MYMAAVMTATVEGVKNANIVEFSHPDIIESYTPLEYLDVSRKYRRLRNIPEEDTIIIIPITPKYQATRQTILKRLGATFSFALILEFVIGGTNANPMFTEMMYIEAGESMEDVEEYLPEWYKTSLKRQTLITYADSSTLSSLSTISTVV